MSTAIIDPLTGTLTVEGFNAQELSLFRDLLGDTKEVNCGKPLGVDKIEDGGASPATLARVHRIYHGSVIEGPGRRSVLQLQGCPIRCRGCYVPQTHDDHGGAAMSLAAILDRLCSQPRDGVTILGGEPFSQPQALLEIVSELKRRGEHVCLYTGYTVAHLRRVLPEKFLVILDMADVLIAGPYVQHLGENAGEWRGSTNQEIIFKD